MARDEDDFFGLGELIGRRPTFMRRGCFVRTRSSRGGDTAKRLNPATCTRRYVEETKHDGASC